MGALSAVLMCDRTGVKISDSARLQAAGVDTGLVAQRATEAYLMQVRVQHLARDTGCAVVQPVDAHAPPSAVLSPCMSVRFFKFGQLADPASLPALPASACLSVGLLVLLLTEDTQVRGLRG